MLISLTLALWAAVSEPAVDPALGDAGLNDVCFVDAQHGWAVGDRGVIWHTDDGGLAWRRQPSGVSCTLWAVSFLNERIGWAVGGWTRPLSHASSGVVLTTENGGQTWTEVPKLGLPTLRRMRFLDARRGWAIGCGSAMYPSGAFVTSDAGRHWQPMPSHAVGDWLAADFVDSDAGALAGRSGALALASHGIIEATQTNAETLPNLVQMRLTLSNGGWLVGDGGGVRCTGNLGATWRNPPGEPPRAASQFDFAALAVRGPQCWIGGASRR